MKNIKVQSRVNSLDQKSVVQNKVNQAYDSQNQMDDSLNNEFVTQQLDSLQSKGEIKFRIPKDKNQKSLSLISNEPQKLEQLFHQTSQNNFNESSGSVNQLLDNNSEFQISLRENSRQFTIPGIKQASEVHGSRPQNQARKRKRDSSQIRDDVSSDSSAGCTAMGQRFQVFVQTGSRPASDASLRSQKYQGSERSRQNKLSNQSNQSQRRDVQFYKKQGARRVKGSIDIKEFDSDDEDSQEDTSNLVVANYDDWLEARANQAQQENPLNKNILNASQINSQTVNTVRLEKRNSSQMGSDRADSSRDVYGSTKTKTKEEIVLPVILMPLKNSPRSLAANKDENFKLAPVQQSPKQQSINQKLEAFQLALAKDNSPRFLQNSNRAQTIRVQKEQKIDDQRNSIAQQKLSTPVISNYLYQNEQPGSLSKTKEITQSIKKLDKTQRNLNSSLSDESQTHLNSIKDQKQFSNIKEQQTEQPGKYYVERNVNIKNRQYSISNDVNDINHYNVPSNNYEVKSSRNVEMQGIGRPQTQYIDNRKAVMQSQTKDKLLNQEQNFVEEQKSQWEPNIYVSPNSLERREYPNKRRIINQLDQRQQQIVQKNSDRVQRVSVNSNNNQTYFSPEQQSQQQYVVQDQQFFNKRNNSKSKNPTQQNTIEPPIIIPKDFIKQNQFNQTGIMKNFNKYNNDNHRKNQSVNIHERPITQSVDRKRLTHKQDNTNILDQFYSNTPQGQAQQDVIIQVLNLDDRELSSEESLEENNFGHLQRGSPSIENSNKQQFIKQKQLLKSQKLQQRREQMNASDQQQEIHIKRFNSNPLQENPNQKFNQTLDRNANAYNSNLRQYVQYPNDNYSKITAAPIQLDRQALTQSQKKRNVNNYSKADQICNSPTESSKNPQIELIEKRLAMMKVINAIKSKIQDRNKFVSRIKSQNNVDRTIKRDQLKEFVQKEFQDQLIARRVSDQEVDCFLETFGYNKNLIAADIESVAQIIYSNDANQITPTKDQNKLNDQQLLNDDLAYDLDQERKSFLLEQQDSKQKSNNRKKKQRLIINQNETVQKQKEHPTDQAIIEQQQQNKDMINNTVGVVDPLSFSFSPQKNGKFGAIMQGNLEDNLEDKQDKKLVQMKLVNKNLNQSGIKSDHLDLKNEQLNQQLLQNLSQDEIEHNNNNNQNALQVNQQSKRKKKNTIQIIDSKSINFVTAINSDQTKLQNPNQKIRNNNEINTQQIQIEKIKNNRKNVVSVENVKNQIQESVIDDEYDINSSQNLQQLEQDEIAELPIQIDTLRENQQNEDSEKDIKQYNSGFQNLNDFTHQPSVQEIDKTKQNKILKTRKAVDGKDLLQILKKQNRQQGTDHLKLGQNQIEIRQSDSHIEQNLVNDQEVQEIGIVNENQQIEDLTQSQEFDQQIDDNHDLKGKIKVKQVDVPQTESVTNKMLVIPQAKIQLSRTNETIGQKQGECIIVDQNEEKSTGQVTKINKNKIDFDSKDNVKSLNIVKVKSGAENQNQNLVVEKTPQKNLSHQFQEKFQQDHNNGFNKEIDTVVQIQSQAFLQNKDDGLIQNNGLVHELKSDDQTYDIEDGDNKLIISDLKQENNDHQQRKDGRPSNSVSTVQRMQIQDQKQHDKDGIKKTIGSVNLLQSNDDNSQHKDHGPNKSINSEVQIQSQDQLKPHNDKPIQSIESIVKSQIEKPLQNLVYQSNNSSVLLKQSSDQPQQKDDLPNQMKSTEVQIKSLDQLKPQFDGSSQIISSSVILQQSNDQSQQKDKRSRKSISTFDQIQSEKQQYNSAVDTNKQIGYSNENEIRVQVLNKIAANSHLDQNCIDAKFADQENTRSKHDAHQVDKIKSEDIKLQQDIDLQNQQQQSSKFVESNLISQKEDLSKRTNELNSNTQINSSNENQNQLNQIDESQKQQDKRVLDYLQLNELISNEQEQKPYNSNGEITETAADGNIIITDSDDKLQKLQTSIKIFVEPSEDTNKLVKLNDEINVYNTERQMNDVVTIIVNQLDSTAISQSQIKNINENSSQKNLSDRKSRQSGVRGIDKKDINGPIIQVKGKNNNKGIIVIDQKDIKTVSNIPTAKIANETISSQNFKNNLVDNAYQTSSIVTNSGRYQQKQKGTADRKEKNESVNSNIDQSMAMTAPGFFSKKGNNKTQPLQMNQTQSLIGNKGHSNSIADETESTKLNQTDLLNKQSDHLTQSSHLRIKSNQMDNQSLSSRLEKSNNQSLNVPEKQKPKAFDVNRLYSHETVASQLKRNQRLAYEASQKEAKQKKVIKRKPPINKQNNTSVSGKKLDAESVGLADSNDEEEFIQEPFQPDEPESPMELSIFEIPEDGEHNFENLYIGIQCEMEECPPIERGNELLNFQINYFKEVCDEIQIPYPLDDLSIQWFPVLDGSNPEPQSIKNLEIHQYGESAIPDAINELSTECYPFFDGINLEPQVQELLKFYELNETLFDNQISDQIEEWPYSNEFNTEPKIQEIHPLLILDEPLLENYLLINEPLESYPIFDGLSTEPKFQSALCSLPEFCQGFLENQNILNLEAQQIDQHAFESDEDIQLDEDSEFERNSDDENDDKSKMDSPREQEELNNQDKQSDQYLQITGDQTYQTLRQDLQFQDAVQEKQAKQKQELLDYFSKMRPNSNKQKKIKLDFQSQTEYVKRPVDDLPFMKPIYDDRVSNGCQANFDDDDGSDIDDIYVTYPALKPNMCDCGIQTSNIHFTKITSSDTFKAQQEDKAFSTDWSLSSMYNELLFKKSRNQFGTQTDVQVENCGNQVEEKQIQQETSLQILSQIECEYNAEILKHKQVGDGAQVTADRTFELYVLGLNTLQALMYVLRLQKEWETVTRPQYEVDINLDGTINQQKLNQKIDSDQCIKLLTRCKKMYDAKQAIQKIISYTLEKDSLAKRIKKKKFKSQQEYKDLLAKVRRFGAKITSSVNTLQEEHRILKRPFIVRGMDYLEQIKSEQEELEEILTNNYFVDDTGTVGDKYEIQQQ